MPVGRGDIHGATADGPFVDSEQVPTKTLRETRQTRQTKTTPVLPDGTGVVRNERTLNAGLPPRRPVT